VNDRRAIFIAVLVSLLMHALLLDFSSRAIKFSWFSSPRDLWSKLDESDPQLEEFPIEIPEPLELIIPPPPPDQLGEEGGTGDALDTIELPDEQATVEIGHEQAALTQSAALPPMPRTDPNQSEQSSLGPTRKLQQLRPQSPTQPIEQPGELARADEGPIVPSAEPSATDATDSSGETTGEPEAEQQTDSSDAPSAPPTPENPATDGPAFTSSDQDSDPFSATQAYEFRPGGTRARGGRDVKLRRPRIDLRFRVDATRLGTPFGLLVEITIGPDSRPTSVIIITSSGSEAIDDAVRLALFDSTFGSPAPDKFRFGVLFY